MMAILCALAKGDSAQDLIEYSLLGALISVVSILALDSLGSIIRNAFILIRLMLG